MSRTLSLASASLHVEGPIANETAITFDQHCLIDRVSVQLPRALRERRQPRQLVHSTQTAQQDRRRREWTDAANREQRIARFRVRRVAKRVLADRANAAHDVDDSLRLAAMLDRDRDLVGGE